MISIREKKKNINAYFVISLNNFRHIHDDNNNGRLRRNLLFGRVRKLVLPPSVVAFLNAGVGPEAANGDHVLLVKRRHGLVVDILHQPPVFLHVETLKTVLQSLAYIKRNSNVKCRGMLMTAQTPVHREKCLNESERC